MAQSDTPTLSSLLKVFEKQEQNKFESVLSRSLSERNSTLSDVPQSPLKPAPLQLAQLQAPRLPQAQLEPPRLQKPEVQPSRFQQAHLQPPRIRQVQVQPSRLEQAQLQPPRHPSAQVEPPQLHQSHLQPPRLPQDTSQAAPTKRTALLFQPKVSDSLERRSVVQNPINRSEKIAKQVNFYFGDCNLPKDKFMLDEIKKNGGWITMEKMLRFPKLGKISEDPYEIMTAIEMSTKDLVEVDRTYIDPETGIPGRLRRNPLKPCPEDTPEFAKELDKRSVFASGFSRHGVSFDEIDDFFHRFDQVAACFQCKEKKNPGVLKGVIVRFESREASLKFLARQKRKLRFQSKPLNLEDLETYRQNRKWDNDTFSTNEIGRTVYIEGFDKETKDEDIIEYLKYYDGFEKYKKRMTRKSPKSQLTFDGSVFVTFKNRDDAVKFLAIPNHVVNRIRLSHGQWQISFYKNQRKFSEQTKKYLEGVENNDQLKF